MVTNFTSRKKEHQLNDEGSQKAASSIGQSEEVQGDPSDVARGQLERYEGTCPRGRESRKVACCVFFVRFLCKDAPRNSGDHNSVTYMRE